MKPSIIAHRRALARRLAEEVLGRIEPRAPGSGPGYMPALGFLLAAAVALLFVCVASRAWALPAGTGVPCPFNGTDDGGQFYNDAVTLGGSHSTGSCPNDAAPPGILAPAAWLMLTSGFLSISIVAGASRRCVSGYKGIANLHQLGYHFGYSE